MSYKMMKVFDCQDGMPQDVKECFYEIFTEVSNDCYVKHEIIPAT